MSRILRNQLLYKGCYAHVISRSIRKLKLFHDTQDFLCFKDLLRKAKEKAGFKIYYYCIMQTHFHLVVRMQEIKDFSFAIRDIKREYAYKFHSKYRLSGPIWRERYKSLLIENEEYLYACGKYIEGNPVKAQLVRGDEDWQYSSARYYKRKTADTLVDFFGNVLREKEIGGLGQADFEKGNVIGSDFFKFQFIKSQRKLRPVPLQ